jgi:transitional endoplasmic reticulum ATPase
MTNIGVPEEALPRATVQRMISVRLTRRIRALEKKLGLIHWLDALDPHAANNVRAVGRMLGLDEQEMLCLAFLLMLRCHEALSTATMVLGSELSNQQTVEVMATVTGLPVATVQKVLSGNGRLLSCQLIRWDHETLNLCAKFDWVSRSFPQQMMHPGFDPFRALRDRILPAPAPTLTWSQFAHLGELPQIALRYVRHALAAQKSGVNLLLHGDPGVGKSEFSRALALELGVELFEVSSQDEDGDPLDGGRRLQALRVLHGFSTGRRCLLVFDEIEDVFPRPHPLFGDRSGKFKGWLNRALENNPTITIWVTNAVVALDPALVRRFDLTIEIKNPPTGVREAQLRSLPVALPEAVITTMAACPGLSPAVVSRAAGVVTAIQADLSAAQAGEMMELIVNQTLQAQGHRPLKLGASRDDVYNPAYINADFDPTGLAEGIRGAKSARLCLYGPPGTGKTAFAKWLAGRLDRKLLVKRASDLLSRYAGEAEKNIARAFCEATESGAVLLIDEVDSFLQERSKALRSWEVTQVNEFLTQMEQFEGIFIASTNLVEGLDAASLRRFDLKAKFDYLKPAQASGLLNAHLAGVSLPPAGSSDLRQLESLENLTPGDFAAVSRQHRFKPLATGAAWVSALESECRQKPGSHGRALGFGLLNTNN